MKHLLRAALVSAALGILQQAALAADPSDMAAAPSPASREIDAARAAIAKRDWKTALDQLQAADRKSRRNADVHNLMGYSYRHLGDLDKAFAHYKTALEIDPQHKGAHEYAGEAYLVAKQPDKARDHLARLKTICGENCEEYRDLAKAVADYKP
jgi:Flp pilus assembly protein TadD